MQPLSHLPTIHTAQFGTGDQAALYIHCSLARHDPFVRLFAAAEATHKVQFFDLPSHGRSGDSAPGNDIHSIVTELAQGLIEGPTHVVGHSFGGTIALRLALEGAPVRGLTLIEPVLFAAARGTPEYATNEIEFARTMQALDAGDEEAAAQSFLGDWGLGVPWDRMPRTLRREAMRGIYAVQDSSPALNDDVNGLLAPGRLEALDIPVSLVEGAQSKPIIHRITDVLEARLPNARRVRLEGGHMVPLTHSAQVAQIIAHDLGVVP